MDNQKKNEDSNNKDSPKKDVFLVVRIIGYILMIFGSIAMFKNYSYDGTPFAFFGAGLVLYLIGKER